MVISSHKLQLLGITISLRNATVRVWSGFACGEATGQVELRGFYRLTGCKNSKKAAIPVLVFFTT